MNDEKLTPERLERILDFLSEVEMKFIDENIDELELEDHHKAEVIDFQARRDAKRLLSKVRTKKDS